MRASTCGADAGGDRRAGAGPHERPAVDRDGAAAAPIGAGDEAQDRSMVANVALPSMPRFAPRGIIRGRRLRAEAGRLLAEVNLRPSPMPAAIAARVPARMSGRPLTVTVPLLRRSAQQQARRHRASPLDGRQRRPAVDAPVRAPRHHPRAQAPGRGLGADVDPAGRLVEEQDLGAGGDPAGDDALLLVAARSSSSPRSCPSCCASPTGCSSCARAGSPPSFRARR
jgi:hypothetical protein